MPVAKNNHTADGQRLAVSRPPLLGWLLAAVLLAIPGFTLGQDDLEVGEPLYHTVRKGDTLYSIARKHGLDYKVVAKRNSLDSQFTINLGQKLLLKGDPDHDLISPKPTKPVAKPDSAEPPARWIWPAKGEILRRFGGGTSTQSKGIDIAGNMSQNVIAAAEGVVTYAGRGMYRDYGNLIILSHSGRYSTVYGHNSEILIKEGDPIKIGQPIARMGSTGTNRVKLHFQIRRSGDAIDPLKILP